MSLHQPCCPQSLTYLLSLPTALSTQQPLTHLHAYPKHHPKTAIGARAHQRTGPEAEKGTARRLAKPPLRDLIVTAGIAAIAPDHLAIELHAVQSALFVQRLKSRAQRHALPQRLRFRTHLGEIEIHSRTRRTFMAAYLLSHRLLQIHGARCARRHKAARPYDRWEPSHRPQGRTGVAPGAHKTY